MPRKNPQSGTGHQPGVLLGFRIAGSAIDSTDSGPQDRADGLPQLPAFVASGPGVTTVLLGRNGAGKSRILNSCARALSALGEVGHNSDADGDNLLASAVLQWPTQEAAERLFASLLAHIGWSSDSEFTRDAKRACCQVLSAWTSHSARPSDAEGLSPQELASQPLPDLRRGCSAGWGSAIPGGLTSGIRTFVGECLSSPCLSVDASGSVGLIVSTESITPEAVSGARELLTAIAAEEVSLAPPLLALYRIAQATARGDRELIDLHLLPAPHPEMQPEPASGWPGSPAAHLRRTCPQHSKTDSACPWLRGLLRGIPLP